MFGVRLDNYTHRGTLQLIFVGLWNNQIKERIVIGCLVSFCPSSAMK
jgi:hypothetical protein